MTKAGPSLKPYSVDGALCEFGWTELYQCNNGGGLKAFSPDDPALQGEGATMTQSFVECQVKVDTGLTDTKNSEEKKNEISDRKSMNSKTTDVDKTTTADKNFETYFQESASIGFEVPVVSDLFSFGVKVTQSYGNSKKTHSNVEDNVKDTMIRTLETTNTLNEDIKKELSTVTTKKTTFDFTLKSPPGYYQSIMALKMTCGPYTIYPNFIDLVGRRLGDDKETHQYHAGLADAPGVTDPTQLLNERRVAQLAQGPPPPPPPPPEWVPEYVPAPTPDDSIVGHAANLLQHLLGFWDKREHAYRRILPAPAPGYIYVNFNATDNGTMTNETDVLNGTESSFTPSFLGNDTFANFTDLPSVSASDSWEDKTQEEEDPVRKLLA